jgi:hypothetical protein
MLCNHVQYTDAKDEVSGWSTADVLLTKHPMFWSEAWHFCRICRQKREPTSGLEPLTCSGYE